MASTRPDTKYLATRSQEEVLAQLGSSLARGLSADEVSRRLEKEGYNEITANQVRWWEIALRQFRSAFIYLLLVAAVIVILIGEYVDGVVILGFVLVNALLGFYQEYRSEQALQALQQFITPRTRVLRESRWEVRASRDLVPGDIIRLTTGDVVPADVRVLTSQNLVVNETVLTGESVPVPKLPDTLDAVPVDVYGSHNLCFSGTTVVGGEAVAVRRSRWCLRPVRRPRWAR